MNRRPPRLALFFVFLVAVAPMAGRVEEHSRDCTGKPRLTSNGILLPFTLTRVEPNLKPCKGKYTGLPVLETLIDKTGRPQNVKVVRSVSPCIDRAAVAALKQWRFCPAERDGKPIEMLMTLKVFVDYR